jgi:hypothetical protein
MKGEFQQPYVVSLGLSYRMGRFTFNGLASGKFGGWLQYEGREKWEIGPELQAVLWTTWDITDILTLELDAGTILNAESIYDHKLEIKGGALYGFGLFAQYNIFAPNCWIRAGVSYATGTIPGQELSAGDPYADPDPKKWYGIFTVPLIFNVGLP